MFRFKSATLWAMIFWTFIFVVVTILMFVPPLTGQLLTQKIILLVVTPLLVWLCSHMYFKTAHHISLHAGLLLGAYFVVIGTILDLIVTIPIFVKTYAYYTEWSLWAGFAETILFAGLVGYLTKK